MMKKMVADGSSSWLKLMVEATVMVATKAVSETTNR
jgi:hypothetical protein